MNEKKRSHDVERSGRKGLRRPFKVDIIFLFCAIIIPTVIAVTTFTYKKNSAAALEMTTRLVEKISSAVIEKTTNFMQPAQVISEITSQLLKDPNTDIGPGSDLEGYLIGILRAQPQIDFVYFGNEQGDFIDAIWPNEKDPIITKFIYKESGIPMMISRYFNEKNEIVKEKKTGDVLLDPKVRPWYKGAKAAMANFWTDPYIFASTKKPGITSASPVVTESGKFLGVVAADITLGELSNFIRGLKFSENGIVFILDKKKQLIAFPDPDRMVKVKEGKIVPVQAVDLNEKRITASIRKFEDTGKEKFTFKADEKRYLAFFTPFPPSFGKDWTIVVLAPEDDFLGPIKKTHRDTLIISGFILLIAVGLGLIFARNLSRPIEKLTDEMQRIRGFELEEKVAVSSHINEIQMMSNAVESMKKGLQAFRRYVPAELVRQLIESGEEAKPGGKERELTLFFSDITEFTAISEQIPARELMINLSEYLDATSRIISKEKGTVDKYIGDAVMAFWGAPLIVHDHAFRAVKAALEIQDELKKGSEFATRIGIHTSAAVVGNIGSDIRFNYTAIGDAVNLASRIEGLNKKYGTRNIISEATFIQSGGIEARRIGRVRVKGRVDPIGIFEPLGLKGDFGYFDNESCKKFEEALVLFEEAKFEEAGAIFTRLSEDLSDPVSGVYKKFCSEYKESSPENFDGVITFTTK
jgi:adenylate cyclase